MLVDKGKIVLLGLVGMWVTRQSYPHFHWPLVLRTCIFQFARRSFRYAIKLINDEREAITNRKVLHLLFSRAEI